MNHHPNSNLSRDLAMPQPLFGRRRPLFCLAMLFCLAGSGMAHAFEQPKVYDLKPKDHVLILGDSITTDGQCTGGFVRLVDQVQHEQLPELGAIVRAIGGYGARMPAFPGGFDYVVKMAQKPNPPTVAIIALGVNDSGGGEKEMSVYTDKMRKAVTQLREAKMTVILCTLIGTRPHWISYSEAVRTIAVEMKCPLIDLSAAYIDNMNKNTPNKNKPDDFLPGTYPHRDGVGHLNMYGEILSATTFLKAFGLKPVFTKYHIRCGGRMENGGFRTDELGQNYYGGGKVKVEPEMATISPPPTNPGWEANWPMEQQSFTRGTKVTLTATPNAGNTFLRWERSDPNMVFPETSPKLTVTIEENMWIAAVFKPIETKKP